MPLLSKRIFNCVKPLSDVKPEEEIYTIPHTKEQFRSQLEYEKRLHVYEKRIWTCQSTGHVNLTHEEAWNSEKAVLKTLKEQFAPCYDKPVLELVHHSVKSLDILVDEAWLMLQQVLVVGERVLLKVKAGGKSMKAVIVKVDPAGFEGNPTSNCNSPSSDKENKDSNPSSSPKKWVPPKLLPYMYSIRFENEDSVIHSVPANDLSRGDKPPSKELLRLFIRTYTVRSGYSPNSPWIVDEAQVKKLDLQNKYASFLLSPIKWKPDEIAKKIREETKGIKSTGKGSSRIKSKMDAKEEKRKEKAKRSISKIEKKSEKLKQQKEKQSKKNEVAELDSSDDSSDLESENEEGNENKSVVTEIISDSDSDTPLSKVKSQLTPQKKSSNTSSPVKSGKNRSLSQTCRKIKKVVNRKSQCPLADLQKQLEKKKIKKDKKKSKKGQDPKQLTLIDTLKKKGMKTPEKKSKSPLKTQTSLDMKKKLLSPSKTPICIEKLQAAIKKKDNPLIGMYALQSAKCLSKTQRDNLKGLCKEHVMKKYNFLQEKRKIAKMTEEEKKTYLENKARERAKEARKKYKNTMRKFEDTILDLQPLPAPTLVVTPDGLPNELFGDIAMVTDFISCYAGLLMPDDEYPIYTDCFMKALASGKDGFTYLCRTLTVLLQTLLQDQIAEDYEELKVPLSDIPVTPGSCSELVRLCLRRHDMSDSKSDTSENLDDVEECEVPDELLQLLETQEFYELEPIQKLAIFKGLCERVMGTYSVQYYMEETQQKSTELWKEKFAKIKAKKEEEKQKKGSEKDGADDKKKENETTDNKKKEKHEKDAPINNMLLTQFYGKTDENAQNNKSPSSNSETVTEDDDGDLITTIKRRRLTTAQAQEERRKKELEDKIRRQQEEEERQKELFEKNFNEGIALAKLTLRQTPVGTDRNHSRYWIFCQTTPGVYVEKGWAGDEMEYTVRKDNDDDVDMSSSSDDESVMEEDAEGTSGPKKKTRHIKMAKCVDTTFPHVGQNLWFTYDKLSKIDDLIETLHPKGARESVLQRELKKRSDDVYSAIRRYQRQNRNLRDCDGEKEMFKTFKKELLESELRLRTGGLGGVDDFDTWSVKLETSEDVSTMADCLLESQANVLEKFRDGIMVIKKKKKVESDDIKEEDEEEEEVKVEAPGIQQWREAVKSSKTMSRLHVLLGILENCVKWEKSAANAKCKICRKKGEEEKLLLCDDCNQAFHIYCLRPALPCVPKGDWKCIACAPLARKRVIDVPGRYHEDSEDDAEIKEAKAKSIKHDEACLECGGDESLILCAECPSAYHLECHDPPLRRPPRGRWLCNDCKNGVKRRTRRGAVTQDARKQGRPASKRKRYVESSDEESSDDESQDNEDNDDYDGETEDEDSKPPPKKAARTSKGRAGRQSKTTKNSKQDSPKNETSKSRSRRSAPSPEPVYETRPKVSRRAPSELSLIEDIINKMLAFKAAWPFWHNVSKKDVPDYYNIIKQPISFQKIKDKLNCLVYGSPQEVIDDVALVFRNAVEYNKVGSEVYDCIDLSEKKIFLIL
ncbi:LOW QUALITY PROTEIN: tyrosine-protein kinase BAZ1B-like [Ruditapes philippinarum]|uniref:LOW QUALITY PROTEIN: tyrosine-protein kinase BAZ1B-like n=1 Tax=Ruditapes philippinarum TaxID=129788 RepID=UPI00295AE4E8|nr:LOW QUALITY PROTEIN: tyrosine-protein kinase BAZ1B-like [Ruditapes philippinarum]